MSQPINLLWTSGWDSTFRLVDLLLLQKKQVQPYYIVSRSRRSYEVEIRTMEKIRNHLFEKAPETRELLLPPILKERNSIKISQTINDKFNRLLKKTHLGDQYVYLASFAVEMGISDLELTIHKDDQAHKFIKDYVVKNSGDDFYSLKGGLDHTDLAFFGYFRFPILDYTKVEMEKVAREKNFLDIMDETWFCHYPIGDQPCGVCNPCRSTIEEGMIRRFPLKSKVRYYFHHQLKAPLKRILNIEKKPDLVS